MPPGPSTVLSVILLYMTEMSDIAQCNKLKVFVCSDLVCIQHMVAFNPSKNTEIIVNLSISQNFQNFWRDLRKACVECMANSCKYAFNLLQGGMAVSCTLEY